MIRAKSIVLTAAAALAIVGARNAVWAGHGPVPGPGQDMNEFLDLAKVQVRNPEARAFLKSDMIRVRRRPTIFRPFGEIAVLKLDMPTETGCRNLLAAFLSSHGLEKMGRVEKRGGALAVRSDAASVWLHPVSGGYKYTVTVGAMNKPTRLKDFKEAVQIGLDHIAKFRPIELGPEEEIDVVSVSSVRNALTEVKSPERPIEEFTSEHYVSFGRRFRGVPVIGSQLTLRLDGNGAVVMESLTWRRIRGSEDRPARLTEKPLEMLVLDNPQFKEVFGSRPAGPQDIRITQFLAGYLEAPVDVAQDTLRPGCLISFRLSRAEDEEDSQIVLSLEEGRSGASPWDRK